MRRYPTRWRRARSPFSSSGQLLAASRGVSVQLLVALAGACGPPQPVAAVWVTTADQKKLLSHEPDVPFSAKGAAGLPTITVDDSAIYQEMVGFGAAITDASALNINRLAPARREALLRELFDADSGLGLSFTRLTIGASDFSTRQYSFDDVPPGQRDPKLARFSIEPNRADVLPIVQRALAVNPHLKIMASPWSAPGWMKTSGSLVRGTLWPNAYGPFAQYLLRYVQAYDSLGVPIYAITIQNEPHFEPTNYPGMRLDPSDRARFIRENLGPLFQRQRVSTLILDWDHNWDEPESPLRVLRDSVARRYIAGVAWHCYNGDVSAQSQVHDSFPAKDAYFTECSGGGWAPTFADNLQWNVRTLIIGATRNWAKGVLLWNLALDELDGPHSGGCGNCRGRRHHQLSVRHRHAQRRVLRTRPRQPVRPTGCTQDRVDVRSRGARERRLPEPGRLVGAHRDQHRRGAAAVRSAVGGGGQDAGVLAAGGRGGDADGQPPPRPTPSASATRLM